MALAAGAALEARRVRAALALAVAVCAGATSLAARLESTARARDVLPDEATVEGRVARAGALAEGFRLELTRVEVVVPPRGVLPGRVLLVGDGEEGRVSGLARALPGERWRLRLRLRAPLDAYNPGARPRARRLARRGVVAEARLVHPQLALRVGPSSRVSLAPLHALRQRVAERLGREGPAGALVAALALGARAGLADARDAFVQLGLAHLLAVSGLHLALAAGLAFALGRRVLVRILPAALRIEPRLPALALAVVVAALQALLAGFGVPVRRALIFLAVLAAAFARGRPVARGPVLALAGLVVLALEPEALFEPGAQLSFAASAALLLASRARRRERNGLGAHLAGALRTTATATLASAPLAARAFGSVAPAALLSNLVAVPWVGAVLLPASLVAGLALGSGLPAADRLLPLALVPARATLVVVGAVAAVLPPVQRAPLANAPWLLACLLAVSGLALRPTGARVAAAGAVLALLALAPARELAPAPPRLVVLDVGPGDAIVVQGRHGKVLVDGGSALPPRFDLGRSVVVPALAALGVRRLDLVVATHADLDHRGGLPAVLDALPVGRLWLPVGSRRDPAFGRLLASARRAGVPVHEVGGGSPAVRFGDVALTPLWPPPDAASLSRNDASLVLRVETGGRRVLLAGDVSSRVERLLVERTPACLVADVLVLPHHGSRTSSAARFLAAVAPRAAVASAPCRGRFDWPHAEVVGRLRARGVPLWWTGRDGAVVIGLEPPLAARGLAPPGRRCRAEEREALRDTLRPSSPTRDAGETP